MDYLQALRRTNLENTLPHATAKTAQRSFDSKDSNGGGLVSTDADTSEVYRLDYTVSDLTEFDALIRSYCAITEQPPGAGGKMLTARRRMRPAAVAAELAEFRRLVAECGGQP
jgi:hypothetical protein